MQRSNAVVSVGGYVPSENMVEVLRQVTIETEDWCIVFEQPPTLAANAPLAVRRLGIGRRRGTCERLQMGLETGSLGGT